MAATKGENGNEKNFLFSISKIRRLKLKEA
jgi:hypothetical protein